MAMAMVRRDNGVGARTSILPEGGRGPLGDDIKIIPGVINTGGVGGKKLLRSGSRMTWSTKKDLFDGLQFKYEE